MLKRLGIPMLAVVGVMLFIAAPQAGARVHFGVGVVIGPPVYTYPPPPYVYPFPNPYPPYAYGYGYPYVYGAPYVYGGYWRGGRYYRRGHEFREHGWRGRDGDRRFRR